MWASGNSAPPGHASSTSAVTTESVPLSCTIAAHNLGITTALGGKRSAPQLAPLLSVSFAIREEPSMEQSFVDSPGFFGRISKI